MVAPLDLYYLFVEVVFGNFLFAVIGLSILLAGIGMAGRMSLMLVSTILMLFLMSMLVGYFGSILAIIFFAITFVYFTWNLLGMMIKGM